LNLFHASASGVEMFWLAGGRFGGIVSPPMTLWELPYESWQEIRPLGTGDVTGSLKWSCFPAILVYECRAIVSTGSYTQMEWRGHFMLSEAITWKSTLSE